MPTFADDVIIGRRVRQAACRLARLEGEVTPDVISAWTGWVGSWTSDWLAFSATARLPVERALAIASQRVVPQPEVR